MERSCGLTKPLCDRRCRRNCGPNLETKPPAKRCCEAVIQLRDVAAKNCVHEEKLSKESWNAIESNSRVSVFPYADALPFESVNSKLNAEADPIFDGSIDEATNAASKCFAFPGKGLEGKWKRFRSPTRRRISRRNWFFRGIHISWPAWSSCSSRGTRIRNCSTDMELL
ncbi:hypothetical protein MPTK1_2g23360 [Marchantia polymorpha subsp. ruderalis]|nr:hypothetical protein Mp_2g23360 [Marchantia polymorpha subsp. ruderalis]